MATHVLLEDGFKYSHVYLAADGLVDYFRYGINTNGSEMEQAVGRARLLWCDCTVYLFSAYPVEQAEYFVEDYLHDRTE